MSEEVRQSAENDEATPWLAGDKSDVGVPVEQAVGAEPLAGWGPWVGAALGFGLGMVFAIGGFWAGVVTAVFTIVGAIVGRILWGHSGGSHA
jgi:hypothetical protein